jgi:hypothetical protein
MVNTDIKFEMVFWLVASTCKNLSSSQFHVIFPVRPHLYFLGAEVSLGSVVAVVVMN